MSKFLSPFSILPVIVFFTLLSVPLFAQGTGIVHGVITDASTGDFLPGSNIYIDGTAIGTSTDLDGSYRLLKAPAGLQTVIVSYIGYKTEKIEVTIVSGTSLELDVAMKMAGLQGEEVVVTAQLQGQAAAINQQISSNTIVNVVSAERIQELPDQNAAESVGRLPGVSIQRENGEGTKVVIRGLSPKFNSITVNGERIPSTDAEDRSVDLSMISPDMLAGIEVFKALTPDMDGDAVGGTVNLITRRASEGLRFNFRQQSGYNDHERAFGQFKSSFSASNRYRNGKFGALLTGNFQRADRSSDLLDVGYVFVREAREGEDRAVVGVNNVNLNDRLETRDRFGGSLTLDYELSKGSVTLNSFWSETQRDEVRRRKRYRLGTGRTEYDIRDRQINTRLLTNSLSGRHTFGDFSLDWRASYSKTQQETPFSHLAIFRELAAFNADVDENNGPDAVPAGAKNTIDATFFKRAELRNLDVDDRDYTAKINLKWPFAWKNQVTGYLKAGGKFKDKSRNRDVTVWMTSSFGVNDIGAANPDLFDLDRERRILLSNFIDPTSNVASDYLDGRFVFGPVLDLQRVNQFGVDFRDQYFLDATVDLEDYSAGEQVGAQYAMAEINLGKRLMFLPGVRFEQTYNDYKSIFGTPISNDDGTGGGIANAVDTTGSRSYTEILPQFHVRYRTTDWMDVRVAATRSLSRPNYFNLVPWERITHFEATVERGNPDLRHTTVWNYDAFLSLYSHRGLITVGWFYKEMDNIDFLRVTRIQVPGTTFGYELTSPVNADAQTTVRGFEVELQTNLRSLPSPWNGIVLYANYAHIESKTFYPLFIIGPRSPDPPFRPTIIDGERRGRLPGQADNIGNFSIGYEKGGFSGRYSLTYQGKALQFVGSRSELDGFSNDFVRQDIAVQQAITSGFSLFFNANNVSNVSESAFLGSTAFPTQEEFFGWTGDFGVRWKF